MKVQSVNVALPKIIHWRGKPVETSFEKQPVQERVKVDFLNIAGDLQGDQQKHGGPDKAVYSYDISYYDYWKPRLDWNDWSPGLFGENLTTEGLLDAEARIGDIYQIGTVKLQAVQPRFPCFRMNARFQLGTMVDQFYQSKFHGIYFRVIEEGTLQVGDAIELIEQSSFAVSILDVVNCYTSKGADREQLAAVVALPHLAVKLKKAFEGFL